MTRELMRVMGSVLLVVGVVWFIGSPAAEAGFVGTATITGKVTNSSGQVITSAKVLVQVTASTGGNLPAPAPVGFWGPRRFVSTNDQGVYTATVGIPERVAADKLYTWVVVAKPGSAPFYLTGRRLVPLAPLPTPGGTKTYSANFTLSTLPLASFPYPYGAFVQGTIRDAETGERLGGATVSFASSREAFVTDAEGSYFGVVPLAATSETISYTVSTGYVPIPGGWSTGVNSGIRYVPVTGQVVLAAGQSWTKDVELAHTPTQTAIVGRVIDSHTGQPVPHELVYLYASTTPMGSGVWWGNYAVTDLFGHYEVRINFTTDPTNGKPLYLTLTTGLFGTFGNVAYQGQSLDVTSRVQQGPISQIDLSLVPR